MSNGKSSKSLEVRHGCGASSGAGLMDTTKSSSIAKIGKREHTREALPPTVWRRQLRSAAYWVLMSLLAWLIYAPLVYLVLRE